MWTFKAFVTPGGRNKVQNEYDRGNDELKAEFDMAALYLLDIPKENWQRPKAAKLQKTPKGGFRDYYEIRFKANKVQQRPIGYFGPKNNDFTILIWAIEKGNKLKPEAWREKADNARLLIEGNGGKYAKEFEFDE